MLSSRRTGERRRVDSRGAPKFNSKGFIVPIRTALLLILAISLTAIVAGGVAYYCLAPAETDNSLIPSASDGKLDPPQVVPDKKALPATDTSSQDTLSRR
jgi:hypothetical protein